jgi:hypothetical protein
MLALGWFGCGPGQLEVGRAPLRSARLATGCAGSVFPARQAAIDAVDYDVIDADTTGSGRDCR